MSVDLYFDMIGRKTAALIAASIEAGALLATDDDEVIARYRGFGWALGLAFQLNDDLLGIWGAEQATGKEPSRHRPAQEDAAGDLRVRARRTRGPRAPGGSLRQRRAGHGRGRRDRGDPRADAAPATTPATRPAAIATRRSPSWTRPASSSQARARLEEIIVSVITA